MDPDDHENDIPIWFNGTQRWMAGLTRRTTCDDIIYAILYSSGLHEAEATDNFAIFEKWREVERPLSSRTKILKVWAFWGEEQPNVSLSMRSLNDYFLPGESSLYMRSKRRHKRQSKHRSSRHSPTCKCHDRRSCAECSRLKSMEHLVKLVVSQERKLQDITDHIVDTDRLIEKHEGRIHEHRVQQNGLDYVQDSYLNSHSSGSSSSVDSACLSVATLDLNEARGVFADSTLSELGEITRMCDQLTYLERRLAVERAKGEELEMEVGRLQKERGKETKQADLENNGVEMARVELLRAVTSHVTQEYNERMLDRRMETCLTDVQDRALFVQTLQSQLADVESRLASNKGNERPPVEGVTQARNVEELSSGSERDVYTPSHNQMESHLNHYLTNHALADPYNNVTMALSSRLCSQSQYSSNERNALKYSENLTIDRDCDNIQQQVDASHSYSPPKALRKSMTGRGRFARDPIRKGSNYTNNSFISQHDQTHSINTDSLVYRGDGNHTSNPSTASQINLPTSTSSRLPNSRSGQSLDSAQDKIDSANISRAGEIDGTGAKHHSGDKSGKGHKKNYQIPSFGSSFQANYSRGNESWKNSTEKLFSIGAAVQNGSSNLTGSCGDLSGLDSSSRLSHGQEDSNREAMPMPNSRGRNGQRGGPTITHRRSRSADRESSQSQAINIKDNSRATYQYSKAQDHALTMDSDKNFRPDHSSIETNRIKNETVQNHRIENNVSRSNTEKFNFSLGNLSHAFTSIGRHISLSEMNANSTLNIANPNFVRPAELKLQRPTKTNDSNQQQNGEHEYSSLFGQSKPAREQNSQIFTNKTPRRTTGFIFRVADPCRLGVPVNSKNSNSAGKDESSYTQNGYCLRTSHDLRAGSQGVQDSAVKNGSMFADKTTWDSQNKQTPNSPLDSYNNFSVGPQTATDVPLQVDTCSIPAKNQQEKQDPASSCSQTTSTNVEITRIETDPSRGALFHILSQKLNASKEKVRHTSMQYTANNQSEKNVCAPITVENQNNLRQAHKQGNVSNGISNTTATDHVTNGSFQSEYCKQQTAVPGKISKSLTSHDKQGGRSFVLATSAGTSNLSENNGPNLTSVSPSSQNQTPPAANTNGESKRKHQQSSPVADAFNDEGKISYPQRGQHSRGHQNDHQSQINQHQQTPTNQPKQKQRTQNGLHLHENNQLVSQQVNLQQRQNQYNFQNGKTSSSYNGFQSQNKLGQQIEPNKFQTVENSPNRRKALNPHFYDISNGSSNFNSQSTSNKKPLLNSKAGLINYQENGVSSDNIMSYLKHSNNGFLENLKSSASPASVSSSRSAIFSANSNKTSLPPSLTFFPPSDSFEINDPRKIKSRMEDSNDSDTGLSSMHSDETANMETLV